MLRKILDADVYVEESPFFAALKNVDEALDAWPIDFKSIHQLLILIPADLPNDDLSASSTVTSQVNSKQASIQMLRGLCYLIEGLISQDEDMLEASDNEFSPHGSSAYLNHKEMLIAFIKLYLDKDDSKYNFDYAIYLYRIVCDIDSDKDNFCQQRLREFTQFYQDENVLLVDYLDIELFSKLFFIYGKALSITLDFTAIDMFIDLIRRNPSAINNADSASLQIYKNLIFHYRTHLFSQFHQRFLEMNTLLIPTDARQAHNQKDKPNIICTEKECWCIAETKLDNVYVLYQQIQLIISKLQAVTFVNDVDHFIEDPEFISRLEALASNPALIGTDKFEEIRDVFVELLNDVMKQSKLTQQDMAHLRTTLDTLFVFIYVRMLVPYANLNELAKHHGRLKLSHPQFSDVITILEPLNNVFNVIEINLLHDIMLNDNANTALILVLKNVIKLCDLNKYSDAFVLFSAHCKVDALSDSLSENLKFIIYIIAAFLYAQEEFTLLYSSEKADKLNDESSEKIAKYTALAKGSLETLSAEESFHVNKNKLKHIQFYLACQKELYDYYRNVLPARLANIHSDEVSNILYNVFNAMYLKLKLKPHLIMESSNVEFISCVLKHDAVVANHVKTQDAEAKAAKVEAKKLFDLHRVAVKTKEKEAKTQAQVKLTLDQMLETIALDAKKEETEVSNVLTALIKQVVTEAEKEEIDAKAKALAYEKYKAKAEAKAVKKLAKANKKAEDERQLDTNVSHFVEPIFAESLAEVIKETNEAILTSQAAEIADNVMSRAFDELKQDAQLKAQMQEREDAQRMEEAQALALQNEKLPVVAQVAIDKDIKEFLEILAAHGAQRVRIVGGHVKHKILGESVLSRKKSDIDVVLELDKILVIQAFMNNKDAVIKPEHGRLKIVYKGKEFDIHESFSLQGKAKITDDPQVISDKQAFRQDALSRDFTCNALYMDKDGNVFDPLECGKNDLITKKLVPASMQYSELSDINKHNVWVNLLTDDPKRIFRAIYFAENENFSTDAAFVSALKEVLPIVARKIYDGEPSLKGELNSVLIKMFRSVRAIEIFNRLNCADNNILNVFFPGLTAAIEANNFLSSFLFEELQANSGAKVSLNHLYKIFAFIIAKHQNPAFGVIQSARPNELSVDDKTILLNIEKKNPLIAYNFNPYGVDQPEYTITDDFYKIVRKFQNFSNRTPTPLTTPLLSSHMRSDSICSEVASIAVHSSSPAFDSTFGPSPTSFLDPSGLTAFDDANRLSGRSSTSSIQPSPEYYGNTPRVPSDASIGLWSPKQHAMSPGLNASPPAHRFNSAQHAPIPTQSPQGRFINETNRIGQGSTANMQRNMLINAAQALRNPPVAPQQSNFPTTQIPQPQTDFAPTQPQPSMNQNQVHEFARMAIDRQAQANQAQIMHQMFLQLQQAQTTLNLQQPQNQALSQGYNPLVANPLLMNYLLSTPQALPLQYNATQQSMPVANIGLVNPYQNIWPPLIPPLATAHNPAFTPNVIPNYAPQQFFPAPSVVRPLMQPQHFSQGQNPAAMNFNLSSTRQNGPHMNQPY